MAPGKDGEPLFSKEQATQLIKDHIVGPRGESKPDGEGSRARDDGGREDAHAREQLNSEPYVVDAQQPFSHWMAAIQLEFEYLRRTGRISDQESLNDWLMDGFSSMFRSVDFSSWYFRDAPVAIEFHFGLRTNTDQLAVALDPEKVHGTLCSSTVI